jgi:hypothetical protein
VDGASRNPKAFDSRGVFASVIYWGVKAFLEFVPMTRGLVIWKQREASRALRAVRLAGFTPSGLEVTRDGVVRVLIGQGNGKQEVPEINEWDEIFDGPHKT